MSDIQKERIEKFLERQDLSDWERNFATSISTYMVKHGRVSNKQWSTFQKAEAKYSPEVIAARQEWLAGWNEDKACHMKVAAEYYRANPPYFGDLAHRVLEDAKFIPTQKQYRAMVENKYVQNVISTIASEPLYPVGGLVRVRRTARGPAYRFRDCIALVVATDGPVLSAAKGAKSYSVLPFGEPAPITIEERYLKKKRG